ncbi:hypothetical protein [uncultured Ruminococcus sp.]|uniref:hypothetical protein n=1 Tax=uncultured Ruminococcus sp. TaxID=165186 RepID=UPI0026274927|nr:hypothetical protein [uncultured Ruminococcus sp.]
MKSIEELQADVKKLYQELEERKRIEQAAAPQAVNFREISAKAKRYAIQGHPMAECDEHTQQMYLLVLLSVAALDDTAYVDSFCTIYRIAHGMHYAGDVQELFLSAQQMNFDKLDECTRLFLGNEKRLLLLLECMLVAGTFDAGRKQAMAYLAQLCVLMKLTKEEIVFLSNLARVVLMQDIQQYQCDIKNTYEIFDCYLHMLENQIEIKKYTCDVYGYENTLEFVRINKKTHEFIYKISTREIKNKYPQNHFLIKYRKTCSISNKGSSAAAPKQTIARKVCNTVSKIVLVVTTNTLLAYNQALKEYYKK